MNDIPPNLGGFPRTYLGPWPPQMKIPFTMRTLVSRTLGNGMANRPPGMPAGVLCAVFLLALGMRLAAVLAWEAHFGPRFVFGDSESYWHLAQCLAKGQEYRYGEYGAIFRTPGYPLFLAPLFWFFEQPPLWLARVGGAIVAAVGVIGVVVWARELFDRKVALVAGLGAALHPELILGSVPILSEALFVPVWTAHLGVLAFLFRRPGLTTRRWVYDGAWLIAGLLAGVATLIRPSSLLWILWVVAGLVFFLRRQAGFWRPCILLGCGFVAAMGPWWLRNYKLTGRWILTTTQVGASLYDGLNPRADGGSNMWFVPAAINQVKNSLPTADSLTVELELDRQLRQKALAWAGAHPKEVTHLALTKFRRFWNIVPNDPGFNRFPVNVIIALGSLLTFSLAAWGAVQFSRYPAVVMICVLPAIYFTLLHLVFVSSLRYRLPAIPGLIVLGSAAVTRLLDSGPSQALARADPEP